MGDTGTARPTVRWEDLPFCRKCLTRFNPADDVSILHRGTCFACGQDWLEPLLARIVERIGRKRTRRLLKALAKKPSE